MPLYSQHASHLNSNKKSSPTVLFLLGILFFPSLPGDQWGEVHVNILVLSAFVLFFLVHPERFRLNRSDATVATFFLFLQLFLLVSLILEFIRGEAELGSIPSSLRPLFMCFTYLGFRALFEKNRPELILGYFFSTALVLFSLWLLVEFLFPVFRSIVNVIYFDTDRIKGFSFLTVFATTYFSGFFYFMLFMYSLARFVFGSSLRMFWFLGVLVSGVMIFFSQGKTSYLAAVLGSFFIVYFKAGSVGRLLALAFFSFLVLNFVLYYEQIKSVVYNIDYFSMHQLYLILEHGLDFGSMSVRIEQVVFAFQLSIDNLMFGVGMGRGIYLESFLAAFFYRYGVAGTFFYFFLFIYLACLSVKGLGIKESEERMLIVFFFSWLILTPVIMISSPMIEMGKNSVFSMMLVAAAVTTLSRSHFTQLAD